MTPDPTVSFHTYRDGSVYVVFGTDHGHATLRLEVCGHACGFGWDGGCCECGVRHFAHLCGVCTQRSAA